MDCCRPPASPSNHLLQPQCEHWTGYLSACIHTILPGHALPIALIPYVRSLPQRSVDVLLKLLTSYRHKNVRENAAEISPSYKKA